MSVRRKGAGVGVLDGVLYAVGGYDGLNYLCSVESYSPNTGVWTSIKDMHVQRKFPGIFLILNYYFKYFDFKFNFQYRSRCIKRFIVCRRWRISK